MGCPLEGTFGTSLRHKRHPSFSRSVSRKKLRCSRSMRLVHRSICATWSTLRPPWFMNSEVRGQLSPWLLRGGMSPKTERQTVAAIGDEQEVIYTTRRGTPLHILVQGKSVRRIWQNPFRNQDLYVMWVTYIYITYSQIWCVYHRRLTKTCLKCFVKPHVLKYGGFIIKECEKIAWLIE